MAALAPGVSYPLAGHRPTLGAVAGLLALWVLVMALWLQAWGWRWTEMPWQWELMVVAWGLTATGWWVWWQRVRTQAPSELVWEPTQRGDSERQGVWRLFTPAWPTGLRAAQVVVVLDLQVLLLVEFQAPQGLKVWCWLLSGTEPDLWLSLRRAVFHPPNPKKPA